MVKKKLYNSLWAIYLFSMKGMKKKDMIHIVLKGSLVKLLHKFLNSLFFSIRRKMLHININAYDINQIIYTYKEKKNNL